MRIHLFIPCFIVQFYPNTALNVVKILREINCDVIYPINQTCCGQPSYNAGHWLSAQTICKKFLLDFEEAEIIVTPSASCAGFLKYHLPKLLQTENIPQIFEFTDFLVHQCSIINLSATFPHNVIYHASCSSLREYDVRNSPKILLQNVKELQLHNFTDEQACCGFGGTFAIKFAAISVSMAQQKILDVQKTSAKFITSTDWSCLMQLQCYIQQKKLSLQCIHIADILANTN